MKRLTWILILLMTASFSGKLALTENENDSTCRKTIQKHQIVKEKQYDEALGTMLLIPVSYNLNVAGADE